MQTLLIALAAGIAFIAAYHLYGRWLGNKIFNVSAERLCPSHRLRDDNDYVPTKKSIVFGHHFTSIAGTGPIVGPAIAVMWGWLPALLWVVFGSIFIGAVHDFGSLIVSLRNNGQTVGDIAGRVINRRTRILFLLVLFLALTIVIAIFGLVIAAVFRKYPSAIFPCMIQIPIALVIGVWLHRKGVSLLWPSLIALGIMYAAVVFGNDGVLGAINTWMASWPIIAWVGVLLVYCYFASVLPVWTLLQPRDYINALQLITALSLVVLGLIVAAFLGGAPPVPGASRPALSIVAPMWHLHPADAPMIFPFLFITIACGAISGFHCLVSSGTSSKQLDNERDARFVGYGAMLTEGFLATLVILACVAGLGLGVTNKLNFSNANQKAAIAQWRTTADPQHHRTEWTKGALIVAATGHHAWQGRYLSWTAAGSLGAKVSAFVDGAANFLKAMGIPGSIAVALMGVLVASFAGTTLDTACRLQRYVVQELAAACLPARAANGCIECGYDLTGNVSGACPECGWEIDPRKMAEASKQPASVNTTNPLAWLTNKHVATIFALVLGGAIAALPAPGTHFSLATSGTGGLILWPLFGATNQLLAGLAFLVIAMWLWRRRKPVWFLILPLIFMLITPVWAMLIELPKWAFPATGHTNWTLTLIALATLALELWMIVEAVALWPRVRGELEQALPEVEVA